MISSSRDHRVLADLALHLAREAPELAARFAFFARLVREEGPPPRELPRKH